jgi:3-oxoacyl-[acyl-carrier protein] reductase
MDLGLTGKHALVAGGSRGGGLAIARELAAEGARVTLTGRDADNVERACRVIRDDRGDVTGIVGDMSDKNGVAAILSHTAANFGSPDILVVNPPSPTRARGFQETPDELFEVAYNQWVMTLVRLTRGVIDTMQANGWGRIVALGSMGMKSPHLTDPVYVMNMRVATAGFIKTLAQEYGQFGITANTVALGPFESEVSKAYLKEAGALKEEQMLAQTAMRRWGRPEELGALVAFLCSKRAGFLTGETIRLDGNAGGSLF